MGGGLTLRNLPENWDEVCLPHIKELGYYRVMRGTNMDERCLNCPLMRFAGKGVIYDYYRCMCWNKCIKEYPAYNDRKEFI